MVARISAFTDSRALFLNPQWCSASDLQIFTYASGALGFGTYFNGSWLGGSWPPHQITHSIQWKELFVILAAATTWADQLSCQRIKFFCNNMVIVQAWQSQSTKHPDIVDLYRRLLMVAAQHNFTLFMSHLLGRSNEIADALSRNNLTNFFFLFNRQIKIPLLSAHNSSTSRGPTQITHQEFSCQILQGHIE